MKIHHLTTPIDRKVLKDLQVGDKVLLSGTVYTARDAAHKRMCEAIAKGEDLPFDPKEQIIFYAGPAPAPPGFAIGSVGPTTSYRMDAYTPQMLEQGIQAMIGKGMRNDEVKAACQKYSAVYFAAAGGVAALLSGCITEAEIIAYEDLGAESIRKLQIKDMPLWVAVDCEGNDIYAQKDACK